MGRVRRLRDLVCAGALVLLTCCVPVGGNITPPPTATLDCTWDPNPPLPPGDPVQTITGETSCAPTPVQVQGITNAVAIAAGNYDTCAVLTDGSVRCWGWGQDGQLGDGSTTNSVASVPVLAY